MADKKTILITGGNSGVGLEACKIMCRDGHKVIATVRSETKGDLCLREVKAFFPDADIHYMIADVGNFQSIRKFVNSFRAAWLDSESGNGLDVLINNAGMLSAPGARHTPDGHPDWEVTMATNCVGPMLLTDLLMNELKKTASTKGEARLVFVGSGLINMDKKMKPVFNTDDIMANAGKYQGNLAYYKNSKVALMICAQALKVEVESESNVKVIYVCPGYVPGTRLHNNVAPMTRIFQKFCLFCWLPPKTKHEGGSFIVDMAVRRQGAIDHDLFLSGGELQRIQPHFLDKEIQSKTIAKIRKLACDQS